ncbi:MAG: Z1 domain-containing protein, partial [Actinomycetota bacterium]|nr:Z1 domain-containing protein [Actinomycetota bacterium]
DGTPELASPPMPATFNELLSGNSIGKALDLIDRGTSPVIIVNGAAEKDYEQDALDFQGGDVWKILVGGTKLSRGFTVEGLTVTYYTRRTLQADTLMQMGRWFGFRDGYRDLVRLYIGRNVPAPGGKFVDLYEAFEAVVRDEEDFRAELERYAAINAETGHPQIKPEDVPPMVFQQVPWLKPTAANKMYNAELVRKGEGGKLVDFPLQADRGDGANNIAHFAAVEPLLEGIRSEGEFAYFDATTDGFKTYKARYGILSAQTVRDAVSNFAWAPNWSFAPNLAFLDEIINKGLLTDFAVVLPDLRGTVSRPVGPWRGELPVLRRVRRPDRPGFSGSSKRQRDAIETIAGKRSRLAVNTPAISELDRSGGPLAVELHTPTRGAMLLTFALDNGASDADPKYLPAGAVEASDIATLFSWAIPYDAAPGGRIGFQTRKSGAGAIIDNDGSA